MHALINRCVLLIWMYSFTVVTGQDCTIRNFQGGNLFDIHFDIIGLEETYLNGRQIIIPCKNGYQGYFKIACTQGQWHKVFGGVCEPKPCGHPGESSHADFSLEFGSDFVFASVVEYKCHRGYIMVSRNTRRTCMNDGWTGFIPVCE
ncbi:hypothetical protein CRUP_007682, partial [Coryphaenoides rupestris]